MSNCLNIIITEFRSGENVSYGFRANDSYGQTYNDFYESWDHFYRDFPCKEALIVSVLQDDAFVGIEYNPETDTISDGASSLWIEGYFPPEKDHS